MPWDPLVNNFKSSQLLQLLKTSCCSNTGICYDSLPDPTVRAREGALHQPKAAVSLLTLPEPCSWYHCWSGSSAQGLQRALLKMQPTISDPESALSLGQGWEIQVRIRIRLLEHIRPDVNPSFFARPSVGGAQTRALQTPYWSPCCFCQKHLLLHIGLLFLAARRIMFLKFK